MALNRSKLSVLFVDDDREVLDCFGRYMEAAGLAVVRAQSGKEAVALARELVPDVIVLDVAMPVMDGFEVVEALQERMETRQIPVVLFTGLPPERMRRAPQIFAQVQKPCAPAHLLGVIRMFGGRA